MNKGNDPKNNKESHFLSSMVKESDSYSSMEMIESLVEKGLTLENVPLQPLYLALKNLPPNQVAEYLPRLSSEQRQLIQDLDLWVKDDLDPDEFDFWVQSFSQCMDDQVREEFSNGVSFLLFLKGRFNIWTFDHEDPQYPDHDNYFLTDDGLLLFEFHEDYAFVSEVRTLIREIYSTMGVEHAYTWLFKMVSEGALSIVEEEYDLKKGRLGDAGFVDYFDALTIDNPYANKSVMDNQLMKREKVSVGVSNFSKGQVLPKKALSPFRDSFSSFDEELLKVKDEKRQSYLQFNFLRLVNGNVALRGSFKDGAIAINRAGEKTKNGLLLGFDYLQNFLRKEGSLQVQSDESLFDIFDFTEVFKVGNSLIRFVQGGLKKELRQTDFDDNEAFLGRIMGEVIDHSFDIPPSFSRGMTGEGASKPTPLNDYVTFSLWESRVLFICKVLPFVQGLYKTFYPMRAEGRIQDHFYLNYTVDEIDAEAIFVSSFANHQLLKLGKLKQDTVDKGKLGLTLEEFKEFVQSCLNESGKLKKDLLSDVISFKKSFGLNDIPGFEEYFMELLSEQLEGYDYKFLEDGDFAHVGGPIIFKSAKDLQ